MRLSNYILSLALFSTLIQCGGEDKLSKDVSISITPSKPLVANSDVLLPIGSGDAVLTITAPFVTFGITVGNESTEQLIVTGFRLESTYDFTDPVTGAIKTSTGTADVGPTSLTSEELTAYSVLNCTIAAGTCDPNFLAKIPAGTDAWPFQSIDTTGNKSTIKFYFSNLPANDKKNFYYLMKLTIIGYFGDPSNVTARVNKSIYFTTF